MFSGLSRNRLTIKADKELSQDNSYLCKEPNQATKRSDMDRVK